MLKEKQQGKHAQFRIMQNTVCLHISYFKVFFIVIKLHFKLCRSSIIAFIYINYLCQIRSWIIKPGVCRPKAGARLVFLKLLLSVMSVCVCVSAPEAINNQWRDMVWYRALWMVKQVVGVSPLFIWQLKLWWIDKLVGVAFVNKRVVKTAYKRKGKVVMYVSLL